MHHFLLTVGRDAEDRATGWRTAVAVAPFCSASLGRAIKRTVHVDQRRLRARPVTSLTETVQHLYAATRREAENRATVVRAAFRCSTVEHSTHADQARSGIVAFSLAEAAEYFLRTARRDAEDRAATRRRGAAFSAAL